ncbi:endoglucanase, partial [Tanacetum coccineum]
MSSLDGYKLKIANLILQRKYNIRNRSLRGEEIGENSEMMILPSHAEHVRPLNGRNNTRLASSSLQNMVQPPQNAKAQSPFATTIYVIILRNKSSTMVRGSRYNVVLALVFWCILASPNACAMNHDYKDALGKAILFFEGQRSGKLPWTQRVKWRSDSALFDGQSKNVNLSGGFYDVGDNVKFGWPMAYTVALLSWAAIEYSEQINSVGQLDYLRSEIRWGADYILKAHVSPNKLYTQVGDGKRDHACWERPEDMDTPRTVIEINTNSPGTEVAADSAAALAAASIVFKGVEPDYYCSGLVTNIEDHIRVLALSTAHTLAWLHKASGERRYLKYAVSHKEWNQPATGFSWNNKFAGAQTLFAK